MSKNQKLQYGVTVVIETIAQIIIPPPGDCGRIKNRLQHQGSDRNPKLGLLPKMRPQGLRLLPEVHQQNLGDRGLNL